MSAVHPDKFRDDGLDGIPEEEAAVAVIEGEEDENKVSNEELLKAYINQNIVGRHMTFKGPFGRKPAFYCDWLSTGRALDFLETFYMSEVVPSFSPTSASTSTVTSLQTTLYSDETM